MVVVKVFSQSVGQSVDPAMRIKALEKGQALMDEILARKFDENSPTGGVPACDTTGANVCAGIAVDAGFDDVGDYNGYTNSLEGGYTLSVTVVAAGTELGISNTQARRVTVVANMPDGNSVTLSAYKANF